MRVILAALLLLSACAAHAHGAGAGSPDVPTLLATLALAISAALYGTALGRGAALRPRHALAFIAGWAAVVTAVLSPLDRAAESSFAMHMVQHELLMVAAPPLLILGRPFTALAATLSPGALRIAAWPLRIAPVWALALHAAALWLWHIPTWFDSALESAGIHALQHGAFFSTALLFWWAVLRRLHTGMAVLYVLTTLVHSGALAALLTFAPDPLYLGNTLEDQQLGGLIMWVPAGYVMVLIGLLAFDRLLKEHP